MSNQGFAATSVQDVATYLDTLLRAGLTGQSLHVALVHYRNYLQTGLATTKLGIESICRELGVHRNTIQNAYRQLVDKKLVIRLQPGIKRVATTTLILPATTAGPTILEARQIETPLSDAPDVHHMPRPVEKEQVRVAQQGPAPTANTPIPSAQALKDAFRRVDALKEQWPAEWGRAYAMLVCYGKDKLPPEESKLIATMQAQLSAEDWQAVELTGYRHEPEKPRNAISRPGNEPAAERKPDELAPRNEAERDVLMKIRRFVERGELHKDVASELYWSITRGELASITRCDPCYLGLRLVKEGRWTSPRSLTPTAKSQCLSHVSTLH